MHYESVYILASDTNMSVGHSSFADSSMPEQHLGQFQTLATAFSPRWLRHLSFKFAQQTTSLIQNKSLLLFEVGTLRTLACTLLLLHVWWLDLLRLTYGSFWIQGKRMQRHHLQV